MSQNRRAVLKLSGLMAVTLPWWPNQWSKPFVRAVALPAHAQTSEVESCSSFSEEQVDEPISISVTSSEVIGPIVAQRTGDSFSGELMSTLQECSGSGESIEQVITFSGNILVATNEVTGLFETVQTCGGEIVCQQSATFLATQNPIDTNSELGDYQGRLMGTLRCCEDFF